MGKPRSRHRMRRVRPDDEVVVSTLYREYHRPLLAFVIRLTAGDRQWAEDVVQETMIRAWRSSEQLDPDSASLMPWLATVARRIVIDDRRRKEARPPESGDGPLESMPVPDEMEDAHTATTWPRVVNSTSRSRTGRPRAWARPRP